MGERIVFTIAAASALASGVMVITLKGPFRATVALIGTLLSVAVLFLLLMAPFVAAIQVIVYAGAIVILFLFVIMLLGVDKAEQLQREPILGQRPAAVVAGMAILGLTLTALLSSAAEVTGGSSVLAPLSDDVPDLDRLGRVLFTDYVFAFEVTAVLLTIAVIGAVVLARRAGAPIDLEEFPDGTTSERMAARAEQATDGQTTDEVEADAETETEEVER